MGITFGPLDAFAFVVFGVLIAAAVVIIVSLENCPANLREKGASSGRRDQCCQLGLAWPPAGSSWPLALIWAFMTPSGASPSSKTSIEQGREGPVPIPRAKPETVEIKHAAEMGTRS